MKVISRFRRSAEHKPIILSYNIICCQFRVFGMEYVYKLSNYQDLILDGIIYWRAVSNYFSN